MPDRSLHEQNRRSWNNATVAHNSHRGDQAAFFRAGGSKVFPEELELLGDLRGLQVVHLQCNAGQDTLSLAQYGAEVTGVDISDTAIEFARQLSTHSGVPATFVRADVYDWLQEAAAAGEQFDIAFSSYGALCWLSDVDAWAEGVTKILKPGGRVVIVEFHPVASIFDEDLKMGWNYDNNREPFREEEGIGDYVADTGDMSSGYETGVENFRNPEHVYEWAWGIGDVVTALIHAGLELTVLREWTYMNGWKRYHEMKQLPGRRWTLPDGMPNMPLMYGLAARKPDGAT
jgi:SAM-dependent methyltransferase